MSPLIFKLGARGTRAKRTIAGDEGWDKRLREDREEMAEREKRALQIAFSRCRRDEKKHRETLEVQSQF